MLGMSITPRTEREAWMFAAAYTLGTVFGLPQSGPALVGFWVVFGGMAVWRTL